MFHKFLKLLKLSSLFLNEYDYHDSWIAEHIIAEINWVKVIHKF